MIRDDNAIFIDTNILVYANLDTAPEHQAALLRVTALEAQALPLWISRQVIREYLATVLRPTLRLDRGDVIATARAFEQRYTIAEETPVTTTHLFSLLEQGLSRQVHDTNIVATMLTYGIRTILTNNADDFAPFAHLITILIL